MGHNSRETLEDPGKIGRDGFEQLLSFRLFPVPFPLRSSSPFPSFVSPSSPNKKSPLENPSYRAPVG